MSDIAAKMAEAIVKGLKPELCCAYCDWNSDVDTFAAALMQTVAHLRVQHQKLHPFTQRKIRQLRRAWYH